MGSSASATEHAAQCGDPPASLQPGNPPTHCEADSCSCPSPLTWHMSTQAWQHSPSLSELKPWEETVWQSSPTWQWAMGLLREGYSWASTKLILMQKGSRKTKQNKTRALLWQSLNTKFFYANWRDITQPEAIARGLIYQPGWIVFTLGTSNVFLLSTLTCIWTSLLTMTVFCPARKWALYLPQGASPYPSSTVGWAGSSCSVYHMATPNCHASPLLHPNSSLDSASEGRDRVLISISPVPTHSWCLMSEPKDWLFLVCRAMVLCKKEVLNNCCASSFLVPLCAYF